MEWCRSRHERGAWACVLGGGARLAVDLGHRGATDRRQVSVLQAAWMLRACVVEVVIAAVAPGHALRWLAARADDRSATELRE